MHICVDDKGLPAAYDTPLEWGVNRLGRSVINGGEQGVNQGKSWMLLGGIKFKGD